MDNLPFLDVTASGFSTKSDEVLAARAQSWCARTPYGLAVLRHRQAGVLLRDRRLRQGSHAWPGTQGLAGEFADFWRRSIISQEGEPHRMQRRIAQAALSNDYILSLTDRFEAEALELIAPLKAAESFDFIGEVSEPFAGRAIALILGLPTDLAPGIARDASTLGLAMAIGAKQHEAAVNAACVRLLDLARRLIDRARRGEDKLSYVARLIREAERNDFQDETALVDLVVISIFGGVDTTRAQLGFAIALLARHAEQWSWLRAHPEAVPGAIEEVVRTWPTTTWSTREALEEIELDGVVIPKGERVLIFSHASATDPLAGSYDGFDIRAERKIHFSFGGGAHHCLGQFVARTDMAAALRICLRRWPVLRLAEDPVFLPDTGNTSPATLRLAPVWA